MSLMSSLSYGMARTLLYVVSFPWTHVMWPCIHMAGLIIQHSLVIPVLLIVRTFLFGLMYLPLVPVLFLLNVDLDTSVPVERTLFRLVYSAWPHFKNLVSHLFHYFMVSLFLGTTVGIVAGINISIASKILRLSKSEVKQEKKNGFGNMTTGTDFASGSSMMVRNHPFVSHNGAHFHNDVVLGNTPRVFSNPVQKPTIKQEDLSASENLVYEDDDGYNFMNLGPASHSSSVHSARPNSSLLSTTIVEEPESESQLPDGSTSPSSRGSQKGLSEEIIHERSTFSTGFNSASSVFSPHVETASTGASESKEQQNTKSASPVKLETFE